MQRVYLDNAATSWPKPEAVYAAVDGYLRHNGAPAGRGTTAEAGEVERHVMSARRAVATIIGAADPHRIVFTAGGTDSLNLALHGILREGGHVVTTAVEHNSVLRPLRALEDAGHVTVTRVPCDATGTVAPEAIAAALRRETKLVALNQASNVTGALQPAAEIGRLTRDGKILFLLDAAQTLGKLPSDVGALGVDLLAASGHKGLLGPLGTGVLYVGPGVEQRLAAVRQGGTGTASERDVQPGTLPQKYESGNLNVPGIVGLAAGCRWVLDRGVAAIREHVNMLTTRLRNGLEAIEGVRLWGPRDAARRVGIVSISLDCYDPQELAALLETAYRVQTRAGLHCAPLVHQALGTLAGGGTLRFSPGPFTTVEEIDLAIAAVSQIAVAGALG